MKNKYIAALDLHDDILRRFPGRRPNCEEILGRKISWALNEDEFEINDKLKKELILKLDDENQIVFTILKSKLNI